MKSKVLVGIIAAATIGGGSITPALINHNNNVYSNKVLLANNNSGERTNEAVVINGNSQMSLYGLPNGKGIISSLSTGEMLTILGQGNGNYCKVRVQETGAIGYINKSNVQNIFNAMDLELVSMSGRGQVVNVSTRLRLRENPSINSSIIKYLKNETQFIILGKQGQWYKVDVNGIEGFIYEEYVSSGASSNLANNESSNASSSASSNSVSNGTSNVPSGASSNVVSNSSSSAQSNASSNAGSDSSSSAQGNISSNAGNDSSSSAQSNASSNVVSDSSSSAQGNISSNAGNDSSSSAQSNASSNVVSNSSSSAQSNTSSNTESDSSSNAQSSASSNVGSDSSSNAQSSASSNIVSGSNGTISSTSSKTNGSLNKKNIVVQIKGSGAGEKNISASNHQGDKKDNSNAKVEGSLPQINGTGIDKPEAKNTQVLNVPAVVSNLKDNEQLDLMSSPLSSSKVLAHLENGNKVTLVKNLENGWFEVKYGDKTGYVVGGFINVEYYPQIDGSGLNKPAVKNIKTLNEPAVVYNLENGAQLDLMSTPSSNSKVLARLENGNRVTLVKNLENGWFEVKYGNKTGYVVGSFINV